MIEMLQYVLAACVGAVPAIILAINNSRLLNFKVEELMRKVEKHNNFMERIAVLERTTDTMWKRQDFLREEIVKLMEENKEE